MTDIYLDTADLELIRNAPEIVRGFTCNPSIIRAAGVTDYAAFAREAAEAAHGLPISLEVIADEWDEMERQGRLLASLGNNINVKIPVTNTKGESAASLVRKLSDSGILCNVTAVFTEKQIEEISGAMNAGIISIFAGRIADTGDDPEIVIANAVVDTKRPIKILWASCREALNIRQAYSQGCHIITITPELLVKHQKLKGKDLTEYSLETVKMFYNDAHQAGYIL